MSVSRLTLRSVKLDDEDIELLDEMRTPDTGLAYFTRKGLKQEKKEREAKEGRESMKSNFDGFLVAPKSGQLRIVEYFDKKSLTEAIEIRILDIQTMKNPNRLKVRYKMLGKKNGHYEVSVLRKNINRNALRKWAV